MSLAFGSIERRLNAHPSPLPDLSSARSAIDRRLELWDDFDVEHTFAPSRCSASLARSRPGPPVLRRAAPAPARSAGRGPSLIRDRLTLGNDPDPSLDSVFCPLESGCERGTG